MNRSIETRSFPNLFVAPLATLPSMLLIPSAPFARWQRAAAPSRVRALLRPRATRIPNQMIVEFMHRNRLRYWDQSSFRLATEANRFTTANPSCGGLAACAPQNLSRAPLMHHKRLMIRRNPPKFVRRQRRRLQRRSKRTAHRAVATAARLLDAVSYSMNRIVIG
jgi:hypothetical protein